MLRACLAITVVLGACGHKRNHDDDSSAPVPVERSVPRPPPPTAPTAPATPTARPTTPTAAPAPPASPASPALAEKPSNAPGPTTPAVADAPAGNPPADGKYERVVVEGVTVPMVNIMNGGTVVLVDTDGKKPRTWEEQYKKKNAKLKGQLDIHKTDVNKNGSFDDDPVDREGIWLIDSKGNITKH